ncbi:MAG: type II toxin-antitoxin system Phd/YefM family antitoxin [Candidatus Omnitrophica bacterium]|nr:type II toxin-antitoxin system Phd/YefM family antitoxin [Candidatus Omnitrophota bacterium]
MYTIKEDTTLVGVSELRTKIERILEEAKHHKIVIEKRNKPLAVLIAIDEYNAMEELLDRIEDYELGRIARAREKRSSKKDYISFEKALRKTAK